MFVDAEIAADVVWVNIDLLSFRLNSRISAAPVARDSSPELFLTMNQRT
jgi:hypothetical protein